MGKETCGIPFFDAVVVGDGPNGLVAASLLARAGFSVALLTSPKRSSTPFPEGRTVALFQPAMAILREIGVCLERDSEAIAPLWGVKILDRAAFSPTTAFFSAREGGDHPFGWNIPFTVLMPALWQAVAAFEVHQIPFSSYTLSLGPMGYRLSCRETNRALETSFLVAADGKNSPLRAQARIKTTQKEYPQSALILAFSHSSDHDGISFEYHYPEGAFTTVPLPGQRSSLVWMGPPDSLSAMATASTQELCRCLQERVGRELGRVMDPSVPVLLGPLSEVRTACLAQRRIFLVGDAAHAVLPIGAQGLNMGLLDSAALVACAKAFQGTTALGGFEMAEKYTSSRAADLQSRQWGIDALNASLRSQNPISHALRTVGMKSLETFPAMREWMVRVGGGNAPEERETL